MVAALTVLAATLPQEHLHAMKPATGGLQLQLAPLHASLAYQTGSTVNIKASGFRHRSRSNAGL